MKSFDELLRLLGEIPEQITPMSSMIGTPRGGAFCYKGAGRVVIDSA